jgi:hypothetical protein
MELHLYIWPEYTPPYVWPLQRDFERNDLDPCEREASVKLNQKLRMAIKSILPQFWRKYSMVRYTLSHVLSMVSRNGSKITSGDVWSDRRAREKKVGCEGFQR